MGGLQLVLINANRIGDTRYTILCGYMKIQDPTPPSNALSNTTQGHGMGGNYYMYLGS
jgi:hypothetical protein